MGLDFSKCDKFLIGFNFKDSFISMSVFSYLDLNDISFNGCEIFESDFIETNLMNANFDNSDLKYSRFHKTNLSFASLENAKNYIIDPNQNNLRKASFSFPEVVGLLAAFDINIK